MYLQTGCHLRYTSIINYNLHRYRKYFIEIQIILKKSTSSIITMVFFFMKIKSYLRSCTLRCFAKYCLYYPAYILILNKNINKFSTSKHEVHALFIISRNTEPSQLTLKCAHSLKHNSTCPSIKTIINKIINTQ